MQKKFRKGPKVVITKNKKVTIDKGSNDVTTFYFGNPDFAEAEKEWFVRFLWAEYCDSMQEEVKGYIYKNI